MDPSSQPHKRSFTVAARAAALASRQAKALLPKGDGLDVFVVRASDGGAGFAWEIRRFGGVTIVHGDTAFATQEESLAAGRCALSRRLRNRSGADRTGAEQ